MAHINASWNMSKRAWVHEFAGLNTTATHCGNSGTNCHTLHISILNKETGSKIIIGVVYSIAVRTIIQLNEAACLILRNVEKLGYLYKEM
jgi:hypothetical protein